MNWAMAFRLRGIERRPWCFFCKDGSRFPAIVSITALRDSLQHKLIGYLLIGAGNSARKQVDAEIATRQSRWREKTNLAKSDFLSSMDAMSTHLAQ